ALVSNTTETAELMYAKAQTIVAKSTILYTNYSPSFHKLYPYGLGKQVTSSNGTVDVPAWTALFGSLDYCECEDCRSIYSPSAYFVDLLQFLNKTDNYVGTSPKEMLFKRRPDLKALQLSCANSDTAMPYLSLALEVLERAVADKLP